MNYILIPHLSCMVPPDQTDQSGWSCYRKLASSEVFYEQTSACCFHSLLYFFQIYRYAFPLHRQISISRVARTITLQHLWLWRLKGVAVSPLRARVVTTAGTL